MFFEFIHIIHLFFRKQKARKSLHFQAFHLARPGGFEPSAF